MTSPCLMCDMEDTDESNIIFRDELWSAEVVPGFEVPGWIVLRTRRHAERITGLNDEELAALGHHARDVVAAVTEVTNAEATYMVAFGEAFPHFHMLITPRGAQVPPERRGGDIMKLKGEESDPVRAREVATAIRAAYSAAVSARLSS